MSHKPLFITLGVIASILLMPLADAGEHAFPSVFPALTGSPPEGFAIGRSHTAYNGSIDGSIYKMNLRTGEGEVLVPPEPGFDLFTQCFKLGMRVDPRSNHLFVAGCQEGNVYVFDADNGAEIMQYQVVPPLSTVINDLAIARDAVYFTDSFQPFLYRLPLSRAGHIPMDAGAATAIPLTGDFVNQPDPFCCQSNGIVATPNGKSLIIGHSNRAELYHVDPATGHTQRIDVNPPLEGFLDGIVMHEGLLYIMTPSFGPPTPEKVQVVALSDDLLSGELLGFITNPYMDGVASGAMFGDRLYINNARYFDFPMADTEYWITEVDITDVQ